jgi:hypothetical protein
LRNCDEPTDSIIKGKKQVVDAMVVASHAALPKPREKIWSKPPTGWVKLSVDGSFQCETGAAGCGMIFRDDEGRIIFSACCYMPRCAEAVEAELIMCREGLEIALERSDRPIIIESDCTKSSQL